jgi:hypothetical protein
VFQNLSLVLIQHVLTQNQKTGQKPALQDKFGLEVVQYQFKHDQFFQTMLGKACQAILESAIPCSSVWMELNLPLLGSAVSFLVNLDWETAVPSV